MHAEMGSVGPIVVWYRRWPLLLLAAWWIRVFMPEYGNRCQFYLHKRFVNHGPWTVRVYVLCNKTTMTTFRLEGGLPYRVSNVCHNVSVCPTCWYWAIISARLSCPSTTCVCAVLTNIACERITNELISMHFPSDCIRAPEHLSTLWSTISLLTMCVRQYRGPSCASREWSGPKFFNAVSSCRDTTLI